MMSSGPRASRNTLILLSAALVMSLSEVFRLRMHVGVISSYAPSRVLPCPAVATVEASAPLQPTFVVSSDNFRSGLIKRLKSSILEYNAILNYDAVLEWARADAAERSLPSASDDDRDRNPIRLDMARTVHLYVLHMWATSKYRDILLPRLKGGKLLNINRPNLETKYFTDEPYKMEMTNFDRDSKHPTNDLHDLTPLGNAKFDLIIVPQTFEHLQFPHVAASQIRAHLADGGFFLFSVPWLNRIHIEDQHFWQPTGLGAMTLCTSHEMELVDVYAFGNKEYARQVIVERVWNNLVSEAGKAVGVETDEKLYAQLQVLCKAI